jgi:hypothetical protein
MSFSPPPPPPSPPFSAAWYGFEPCCGGNVLYFRFDGTTNPPIEGINIYNGPAANGYDVDNDVYIPLTNQCYRIFRGNAVDPMSPVNGGNYNNLQVVPTDFGSNYTWDSTTNYETPCGDEEITCPRCEEQCYSLYSCESGILAITTNTDLSEYLGGFAYIQADADAGYRCYFVTLAIDCSNAITVTVDPIARCTCEAACFEIIGTAKLDYVDPNGNPVSEFVNGYWKGCSLVYPITNPSEGPELIIRGWDKCTEEGCPSYCFRLRDCNGILEDISSTNQYLSQYATTGQIVQIEGYDACWEVDLLGDAGECKCSIDVVVLQVYDNCKDCNVSPNYKLVNCDDPNTIIYTSLQQFNGYVGQVIKNCEQCWIVYEVNGPIPSNSPVDIQDFYVDCESCKARYYSLTDCIGREETIITTTDLSNYVGSIIILDWCPTTCWQVEETSPSLVAGNIGSIANRFNNCYECAISLPCTCSRIKNYSTETHVYLYQHCDGGGAGSVTLQAGERSDRICLVKWFTSYPTDNVEYFGDCTGSNNVYTCPPQIYPKRIIKPGYTTPVCSTEKYEKITCKSSEILYKQVMNLRYGISNCCPDEDDKWLIKKQLIDLVALKDPDYTCALTSCGCGEPTCGCGCNTSLKTCNSN